MKINEKINLTLSNTPSNKSLIDLKSEVNINFSNNIILGRSVKWLVFSCISILWLNADKSHLFSPLAEKSPTSVFLIGFVAFLFLVTLRTKNTNEKQINDVIDSSFPNIPDNLREDVFISLLNEKNLKEMKKHKNVK